MNSKLFLTHITRVLRNVNCNIRTLSATSHVLQQMKIIDPPDVLVLEENNFRSREGETLQMKKMRLTYQSRKRGMLENDIILSTFIHKYLHAMSPQQIEEYDKLINLPSNDWDIFNWALGNKPTPPEFNNSVMDMLKSHVKNTQKEKRYRQPELYSNEVEKSVN